MIKSRFTTYAILIVSFGAVLGLYQPAHAQQGRGIFFSVFGPGAPLKYGDFDNAQAFYFEIPADEERPYYLRIFDADLGGHYEELHGTFDTRTRYILLGGSSASKIYGGSTDDLYSFPTYDNRDVLYDRTYGEEPQMDGRYLTLGELPKNRGYKTDDGYLRYVLIVKGLGGDDSNYFDLLLSYDPDSKDIPDNIRTYVYDLSIRIPDWPDFLGQVKLHTYGHEQLQIKTYDMDDVPIAIERPFKENVPLESSGDGIWETNEYTVDEPEFTEYVGLNIEGRDFNNTFGLIVQDSVGKPLPIQLPIKDYEPIEEPVLAHNYSYESADCREVALQTRMEEKGGRYDLQRVEWIVNNDTLTGEQVTHRFDTTGYHSYTVRFVGVLGGRKSLVTYTDSIYVNRPPMAWAGGDRVHIPDEPMAFDGTVSEDLDGKIEKYIWNFDDGIRDTGARIDHTYDEAGRYEVQLTVVDNSNTPCNDATAVANVKINEAPRPEIKAPEFVQLGEVFTLDGSKSYDPDGQIVDYVWHIGRDTILKGSMVQYAFKKFQDRPIKLRVKDNSDVENSVAEDEFMIHINRGPVAVAGEDKLISPERPATFRATKSFDPDGEIIEYEWQFGDQVKSGPVVRHGFAEPGDYMAVLRVVDNTGRAESKDSLMVHVNYPPEPKISGDRLLTRGRVKLSAEESIDQDGKIIKYQWDMGDGTVKTGTSVRHKYTSTGKYPVKLTVVDNSGTYSSVQSTTADIVINKLPVAAIRSSTSAAPGDTLLFDASQSKDPDGTIQRYTWDFGDGTTTKGQQVLHSFENPGTYQVQLAVMDNTGLEEGIGYEYQEVAVNHAPQLVVDHPEYVSLGKEFTVDVSQSTDPDGSISRILWNSGNGWNEGGPTKTFTATEQIVNNLRVAIVDDANVSNSRVEQKIELRFNSQPIAIASDDVRTHRKNIIFDGSKSYDPDNDELKYYWDFGDGESAQGPIVSHTYDFGGEFQAVLTVDDQRGLNNSFGYDTVDVFINRPPDVYFELPLVVCVGDTFRYDASKSFDIDGNEQMLYEWTFGDGNNAQSMTGTHIYQKEGSYTVTLTVDDTEGMPNSTASFTQTVQVVGAPEADAGEDIQACVGERIQFDGSNSSAAEGVINEYRWDFGDGSTGSGVNPGHMYTEAGTYTVQLQVRGNDFGSCSTGATDQITVEVLPKPVAEFHAPTTLIKGEELELDASPSLPKNELPIQEFKWEIGDSETITWTKRVLKDSLGNVIRREWVSESNKGRGSRRVTIQPSDSTLPVSTRELPVGTYNIKLHVMNDAYEGCNTTVFTRMLQVKDRRQLTMKDIPMLVPGNDFEFSLDQMMDNPGNFETISWNFGDGTTKEGFTVKHTYEKPGIYTVEFKADDGRGTKYSVTTLEQKVKVNAPPKPVISGPSRITPGTNVTFDASRSTDPDGQITEYSWFFSDGTRKSGTEVSHTFRSRGNYSVSLTVHDNAGVDNSRQSTTKSILVDEAPELTLKLPTIICPDVPINIIDALSVEETDSSLISIYVGNKEISYSQAKNQSFSFPGVYNLTVNVNDGSGSESAVKTVRQSIKVNGAPQIYANVPNEVTIGAANDFARFDASKTFDPNGDITSFYWNLGDGTQKAGKEIIHEYKEPGTYTVTLRAVDDKGLSCSVAEKEFEVKVVRE